MAFRFSDGGELSRSTHSWVFLSCAQCAPIGWAIIHFSTLAHGAVRRAKRCYLRIRRAHDCTRVSGPTLLHMDGHNLRASLQKHRHHVCRAHQLKRSRELDGVLSLENESFGTLRRGPGAGCSSFQTPSCASEFTRASSSSRAWATGTCQTRHASAVSGLPYKDAAAPFGGRAGGAYVVSFARPRFEHGVLQRAPKREGEGPRRARAGALQQLQVLRSLLRAHATREEMDARDGRWHRSHHRLHRQPRHLLLVVLRERGIEAGKDHRRFEQHGLENHLGAGDVATCESGRLSGDPVGAI